MINIIHGTHQVPHPGPLGVAEAYPGVVTLDPFLGNLLLEPRDLWGVKVVR